MKDIEFEKLVREALLEMPEHIREKMDNVAIVIENDSPRGSLLGLYEGVPQNSWGRGFGMRLPDKITIFRKPLERAVSSPEQLRKIVKNVVWHEVAHHFGFNEKQVRELERRKRRR
jgi:predicted Zn-dependent protease with MMP-like domain